MIKSNTQKSNNNKTVQLTNVNVSSPADWFLFGDIKIQWLFTFIRQLQRIVGVGVDVDVVLTFIPYIDPDWTIWRIKKSKKIN